MNKKSNGPLNLKTFDVKISNLFVLRFLKPQKWKPMKFRVAITGEFSNIKGLRIVQSYFIKVKCGSCNTDHAKDIYISDHMLRELKIKEKPHETEVFNLAVQCRECQNVMGIIIHTPEDTFDFISETNHFEPIEIPYVSPVINDKCHISTIISSSAIITGVDGLILDAISMQDKVFRNCLFSKRILAEDDYEGKTIDIQNFCIKVEEI